MKQFKDLQPGDIIYYYDHCTMKPRTVERTDWDIKEEVQKYIDEVLPQEEEEEDVDESVEDSEDEEE